MAETHWSRLRCKDYVICLGLDLKKFENQPNLLIQHTCEAINHEFLHCLLWLNDEKIACHNLEFLWYKYEENADIDPNLKAILKELRYSGIGWP